MVEPRNAPALARVLAHPRRVAKLALRAPGGRVRQLARSYGVALQLRAMKAELVVQLGFEPAATSPIDDSGEPFTHGSLRMSEGIRYGHAGRMTRAIASINSAKL